MKKGWRLYRAQKISGDKFMISLAPYNCLRKDWIEQFYPEDLPVDWRIDYYANEYRSLFVPADHRLRPEYTQIGAFPEFEQLVHQWHEGQSMQPLCDTGCPEIWLATEASSAEPPARVWKSSVHAQLSGPLAKRGHEAIVLLDSSGDLRRLRAEFEVISALEGVEWARVFLDASPAILEQAKTLLALLGEPQF